MPSNGPNYWYANERGYWTFTDAGGKTFKNFDQAQRYWMENFAPISTPKSIENKPSE